MQTSSSELYVMLGLASLAVLCYMAGAIDIDWDDAYISYRYARNFAEGNGLTYNPGEHIYGTTTVPWAIWLGGASYLTGVAVPAVAAITSVVLLPANLLLFFALLRRAGLPVLVAGVGGLLLLSAPHFLLIATTGMETMLYCCVILLALLAYQSGYWLLAGLLAGVAAATRLDGLAVAAALGLSVVLEAVWPLSQRATRNSAAAGAAAPQTGSTVLRLAQLVVGFLIVAIPFAWACWDYYGSPVPHTFFSKRLHHMFAGRWWMVNHFVTGPGLAALAACAGGLLIAGLVAVIHRVGRSGASEQPQKSAIRRFAILPPVLIWLCLYVGAWTAARIDSYPWYIAAMGPATAILCLAPLFSTALRRSTLARVFVCCGSLVVVAWWSRFAYLEQTRFHIYAAQFERPRRDLGRLVHAAVKQQDKVPMGAGAIGLIGWVCPDIYIVDYAGLVSPRKILDDPNLRPTLMVLPEIDEKQAERYRLAAELIPSVPGPPPVRAWILKTSSGWGDDDAAKFASHGVASGQLILHPLRMSKP